MSAKVSRRSFLSWAVAAAAGPYIVPASALGKDGMTPPSERIQVGCIGIRSRGMHDLRWMIGSEDVQVLAICDVGGGVPEV